MSLRSFILQTSLLVLASPIVADLPYNPTRLILSPDKSKVYQFSPSQFSYLDVSTLTSSSDPIEIHQPIPFQTSQAFTPIADTEGITVVTGDCQDESTQASLWRFTFNKEGKSGTWRTLSVQSSDTSLVANYLSAGFSFSANGSIADISLYAFGGMCPSGTSNSTNWTSQASYSNTMLSVSSKNSQSPYQLSVTGTRAPPIAEAGLTITPLSLITAQSAIGTTTQQQNFVLLGGHTQTAFINMSQVALFSLPEASWSFIGVNQPSGTSGELVKRDEVAVAPRSGHTAVLTEDGTRIIVFGGWVGDVTQPASPQLAVLQLGQSYGGSSAWQWTVPKQTGSRLSTGQGVYGHGAVMLPGNIMMVTAGTNIGSSKRKRAPANYMFFDANTGAWSSTYQNSNSQSSGGLDSKQRAGLGAGLGLGLTAVIAVLVAWLLYRRRLNKKRIERERHLRELAFGSERFQSTSRVPSMSQSRPNYSDMRSTSWGSRQEQQIENTGFSFPWSNQSQNVNNRPREGDEDLAGVARTGMEVPSPTRGLRKSLASRGPPHHNGAPPTTGAGTVFRIDEVEEEMSIPSIRVKTPAGSRLSDPFKDPPNLEPDPAAEKRKREVQGWVEDWQSAAVSMNLSRNPSHARTYSNLSQAHSSSGSSYRTGRESPDKSDRTGSNLSERSQFSIQRSVGAPSRQMSQRSLSAGYALFSGAVAAMGRIAGTSKETALERTASKRSISLQAGMPKRMESEGQRPESRALLHDLSPTKSMYEEPTIKDYKNNARTSSLTSQRKKLGIMGSVKRVLTGTGSVDVQAHVGHYEERSGEVSPTKTEQEMSETNNGPAFWRGKKGAKDWDEDNIADTQPSSSSAGRQRSSTIGARSSIGEYEGEDWDVETAVQNRVVQVMFTVPKEKLRVVNADGLSLMSRSDIDEREDNERKTEIKRMDSVKEDDDDGRISPLVGGEVIVADDGRVSPLEDEKGDGKERETQP